MPFPPILRNVLKTRVMGQDRSRGFLSPSTHARKAVGTVANHRQVIRDGLRSDAKLSDDAGFIAHDILPAVELHDSRAHNALTEIFVRRADEDLPNAVTVILILRGFRGGRGERVIRLELDHGPHHYS